MTSAPITTSDLAHRAQDDKLSLREKIGYGLGDAGGTVITCLIMNFLTFFYTDVFGLTPALVGTLFIALRVFDAISDPIMGVLADRTQSRWGAFARGNCGSRFRSVLLACSLLPSRTPAWGSRSPGHSAPISCSLSAIPPSTYRIVR